MRQYCSFVLGRFDSARIVRVKCFVATLLAREFLDRPFTISKLLVYLVALLTEPSSISKRNSKHNAQDCNNTGGSAWMRREFIIRNLEFIVRFASDAAARMGQFD